MPPAANLECADRLQHLGLDPAGNVADFDRQQRGGGEDFGDLACGAQHAFASRHSCNFIHAANPTRWNTWNTVLKKKIRLARRSKSLVSERGFGMVIVWLCQHR